MPARSVRQDDCTFEDFVDLVADGQKADLLDGVIYMASPDNTVANRLNVWLAAIMSSFVEVKDLGTIYVLRVAYRIGRKRGPEPDIGFVPRALEATRRRGFIDSPPRLAVEIVSPDSVQRDYVDKRAIYEQARVAEYWIIDPDERKATFLVLRGGRYKKVSPVNHIYSSKAIPGLRLDVRWLWSDSRPPAYRVLQQLFGEE
jgi:Uma2 family endonuclease